MPPKPEPVILKVRVVPRSSRNKIDVVAAGELKIWVTSPPVDGEANEAVCAALAKGLGLPKANVELVSGATSREKRIAVSGLTLDEITLRLSPR